jgi:DNA/RNA-binding domain of Phe-tRNA-synthetase-like protein
MVNYSVHSTDRTRRGDPVIEDIVVDDAVRALRPDFAVLVVVARGVRGGESDGASRELLRAAAATDPERFAPVLDAWRDAYRAFGAKPQRTRPSVDALLRRAPAGLPEINRLVDTYNAISVKHGLPVGGEDLDTYRGAPRLVRAAGDEPFDTVAGGEPAVEYPEFGEVVWRDDEGVTCRRWNWRQCVRTRVTERTSTVLFLLERLDPMPLDALRAAGDELVGLLDGPGASFETRLIGTGPVNR